MSSQALRRDAMNERSLARRHAVPRVAGAASFAVDDSGRVIGWSYAAEQLFGWRESEVAGRFLPILSPDHVAEIDEMLAVAREGRGVPDTVMRLRRRTGGDVELMVSWSAIRDATGDVTGLLGVARTLPTLDESPGESGMEAIGRLAGGVAHDFSNILTAIEGYASLLAGEIPKDDPKQEDLAEIRKAAERAKRLVRQLLAFGRREAHQPRLLDLNEVIGDVMPMVRQLLGPSIEVVTIHPPDLGSVLADPSQIEQVLVNLALNARDAMPAGGRLTVRTANVQRTATGGAPDSHPGPYVRLTVQDTGTGMDHETLSHIFEPYFTTKDPGQGHGPRVVHRVRHRQTERWLHRSQERPRLRNHHLRLAASPLIPR